MDEQDKQTIGLNNDLITWGSDNIDVNKHKLAFDVLRKDDERGQKMDEQDKQELEMLRAFYLAWVGLHSTERKPSNREIMEIKAQMMVEAAHVVSEFRKSRESKVILNG